jgi:hypothetical protein
MAGSLSNGLALLLLGLLLPSFVLSDFTGQFTSEYGDGANFYVRVEEDGNVNGFYAQVGIARGILIPMGDTTVWRGYWYEGGGTYTDGSSTFGRFSLTLFANNTGFDGWWDYHLPSAGNEGQFPWTRQRVNDAVPSDEECLFVNASAFSNASSLASYYTNTPDSVALCDSVDGSNFVATWSERFRSNRFSGAPGLSTGALFNGVYTGDWTYVAAEEIRHGPDMWVSYGREGNQIVSVWWTDRGKTNVPQYTSDPSHHGITFANWDGHATTEECLSYFDLQDQSGASKVTFSLLSLLAAVFVVRIN